MNENPYESPVVRAELVRKPAGPIVKATFRYCLFFAVLAVLFGILPIDFIWAVWLEIACLLGGLFYLARGVYLLATR